MTPVLEILSGDLMGRAYDVDEAPFTIGRKEDCAIVIPKRYFSRQHAEIVERGGRYFVRGLSKKNPIVVSGREVEEKELADGAQFEICGIQFRFRTQGAKGASRDQRSADRSGDVEAAGVPTGRFAGSRKDDIEDGPLPGEESTAGGSGAGGNGSPPSGGRSSAKGTGAKPEVGSGPAARSAAGKSAAKAASTVPPGGSASGSNPDRGGWRPSPDEGPRGRIVFGEDDPSAESPKKSQKSQKSGSGDDKDERTDQIDVSKLKKAAEEEDPFAAREAEQKKAEVDKAQGERFLKALVVAGLAGILAAAGVVYAVTRPDPPKTFVVDLSMQGTVGVGETRLYEEPLSENDPPLVNRSTPTDGSATDIIQADDTSIARAEWAVPETQSAAYFLVTGIAPGETQFSVQFARSKNTRIYKIVVGGPNKHETLKKKRLEDLASRGPDELKQDIDARLAKGADFLTRVGVARAEQYPRRALHEFELAEEALGVLAKKTNDSGVADPQLDGIRTQVRAQLEVGKQKYRDLLALRRKTYNDLVSRGDFASASKELYAVLWVIGDTCELDYRRFHLLLDKIFTPRGYPPVSGQTKIEEPGCIEEPK